MRSPIETMIDNACGVPPSWVRVEQAPAKAIEPPDGATKALMHVADCAKSWAKAKSNGRKVEWHERRLERATAALVALGW